jgi:hypothetical protein
MQDQPDQTTETQDDKPGPQPPNDTLIVYLEGTRLRYAFSFDSQIRTQADLVAALRVAAVKLESGELLVGGREP